MRNALLITFILMTITANAQKLTIITTDKSKIDVVVVDSVSKVNLIKQFGGTQNNALRKKWTARTFQLTNGQILIELYDHQAILINNPDDYKKLNEVRFTKNTLAFLKKNVSYKIELDYKIGLEIMKSEQPKKIKNLKSDMPELFDFDVYQMTTGQIMYLDKSKNFESATIYPDLKTLSADNSTLAEQVYGSDDEEHLMKRLAKGDALPDYEFDNHLVYPKFLKAIISSHQLTLIEKNLNVDDFYSNLYQSAKGYYMLIDEVKQKNGAGEKMLILSLRIYPAIDQIRDAQRRYKESKNKGVISEHFYQQISNKYGQLFPKFVDQLIDDLPTLINIDEEQLSFDSVGISIVDEAVKWNCVGKDDIFLDRCFPALIAYYGKCYITVKKKGTWATILDKEFNVWIPMVKLNDDSNAWDWIRFYKDLYEGPVPLTWAGNWDGRSH